MGERRGERDYLHLLKLAADTSQNEVEEALTKKIDSGAALNLESVRRALPGTGFEVMEMLAPIASLGEYDLLLQSADDEEEEEVRYAG